jgi:glutamate carboxypeptidase
MDPQLAADAAEIAARAEADLAALVDVSSPSGDLPGAEEAIRRAVTQLPPGAEIERLPCSTAACAGDLLATLRGRGERRVLLLGHLDTVVDHGSHQPLRREGARLYGSGSADMKGGDVLALGCARALARRPEAFAELAVLLVVDEEWRIAPFRHVDRFAAFDACLCFEAGERTAEGDDAVVVKRKAAGTMRVRAHGRAAHSGSAPQQGRNALLALAHAAIDVTATHDPDGADRLTVVPTVVRSGDAFNVVPAHGELLFDMRAERIEAFDPVLGAVVAEHEGVRLEPILERAWPSMDSRAATTELLAEAAARLGRPLRQSSRGGASDASHFAGTIPLTIDGLGPRGGGAHTPGEFVLAASLRERAEIALAILAALFDTPAMLGA